MKEPKVGSVFISVLILLVVEAGCTAGLGSPQTGDWLPGRDGLFIDQPDFDSSSRHSNVRRPGLGNRERPCHQYHRRFSNRRGHRHLRAKVQSSCKPVFRFGIVCQGWQFYISAYFLP